MLCRKGLAGPDSPDLDDASYPLFYDDAPSPRDHHFGGGGGGRSGGADSGPPTLQAAAARYPPSARLIDLMAAGFDPSSRGSSPPPPPSHRHRRSSSTPPPPLPPLPPPAPAPPSSLAMTQEQSAFLNKLYYALYPWIVDTWFEILAMVFYKLFFRLLLPLICNQVFFLRVAQIYSFLSPYFTVKLLKSKKKGTMWFRITYGVGIFNTPCLKSSPQICHLSWESRLLPWCNVSQSPTNQINPASCIRAADCIKAARFPDPLPLVFGRFVPGRLVPGPIVPVRLVPGPIVPASSLPVLLPLLPAQQQGPTHFRQDFLVLDDQISK